MPSADAATADPVAPDESRPFPGQSWEFRVVAGLMFGMTLLSTIATGQTVAADPSSAGDWSGWWIGCQYAIPLLAILVCHEAGHYFVSLSRGVAASPPIFLPVPPQIGLFGTMGAITFHDLAAMDRRSLFDIAVAGPLCGLVIAIPVAAYGVASAEIAPIPADGDYVVFGDPLLLEGLIWLRFGTLPPGQDVLLNPLILAGWAGLFLTGLNLLPIGQLDGGHVLYALMGRRASIVAWAAIAAASVYMIATEYWAFLVMVLLLVLMGVDHPPTRDDAQPLGWKRTLLGWSMFLLMIVCFTPRPIDIASGSAAGSSSSSNTSANTSPAGVHAGAATTAAAIVPMQSSDQPAAGWSRGRADDES